MLVHVISFRFLCDNQKDLDELLDCLHPQGVRESQLKERLEKRWACSFPVCLLKVKAYPHHSKPFRSWGSILCFALLWACLCWRGEDIEDEKSLFFLGSNCWFLISNTLNCEELLSVFKLLLATGNKGSAVSLRARTTTCFQASFKERSALVEHVDHDGYHCCLSARTAHRAVACIYSKVVFDFPGIRTSRILSIWLGNRTWASNPVMATRNCWTTSEVI